MEPDETYHVVLCRHLVWMLTDPPAAFSDWLRILRSGGRLLVCDGDWARPAPSGRLADWILRRWGQLSADPCYDCAMGEQHALIMHGLQFGAGLTFERLAPLLEAAGFTQLRELPRGRIARAQRQRQGTAQPASHAGLPLFHSRGREARRISSRAASLRA